jgi:hypothetical protein
MSKLKNIIIEALLPVIKRIGKLEMEVVLTGIKANKSPEIYFNVQKGCTPVSCF